MDRNDLLIETGYPAAPQWVLDEMNEPYYARVTHAPSGLSATVYSDSAKEARRQAIAKLEEWVRELALDNGDD